MISCGVRESLCLLAKHRMIDVVVTTAGGIEEDLIKVRAAPRIGARAHSNRHIGQT